MTPEQQSLPKTAKEFSIKVFVCIRLITARMVLACLQHVEQQNHKDGNSIAGLGQALPLFYLCQEISYDFGNIATMNQHRNFAYKRINNIIRLIQE